ncbi:MAG: aminoglycoside phosphotransferase family protein [Stackebrandtia sp.]
MHADQVDITVDTVTRLVAEQFPQWRDLPVRSVESTGTVSALFRLGNDIVLRFPFRPRVDNELRREQEHARTIASNAPVRVSEPLGIGEPGEGYPGRWAAYGWIPGTPATTTPVGEAFASDLAAFVRAVRAIGTDGATWDGMSRGGPLWLRDEDVREALAASNRLTDTARIEQLWKRCRDVPRDAADTWIHADLMPGNLLVRDGRLAAVIDFETVAVGDPAVDLMPAWNLFDHGAREVFRRKSGADEATWERGRGWAIVQAIVALPYYVDTNPVMAETARHTLNAVME